MLLVAGQTVEQAIVEVGDGGARGSPPRFRTRARAKPTDMLGHPATHRQQQLNSLKNTLTDLRAKKRKGE